MANRFREERRKAAVTQSRLRKQRARDTVAASVGVLSDPANLFGEAADTGAVSPFSFPRPGVSHLWAASILAILACIAYGRIAWNMITHQSDSSTHVYFAKVMLETGKIQTPHFLFQALVAGIVWSGLTHSFEAAALTIVLFFYALTALVIYALLLTALQNAPQLRRAPFLFCIAVATILVEPLGPSHNIYEIGYLWPTTYDSPTLTLTKPLSLISFIFCVWCLTNRGDLGKWKVLLFALASAAAALSKPSFIICLAPVAGVALICRRVLRQPLSAGKLILGFFVPAALVLGWQFWMTYAGYASSLAYRDRIVWAPLLVMHYYSSHLAMQFLYSIAFPLAVLAFYWSRARRDAELMLAWAAFLVASFYMYMLAEKAHALAGNFAWSGYAAAFILFVATVLFWLRQFPEPPGNLWRWARTGICGAFLVLHAARGAMVTWLYFKNIV